MRNDSTRLGIVEGWLSTVVNFILFGVKFWVGYAVGSVSMEADAWHTLSDSLTSIVVLVGFRVTGKPADDRHPFGHGRAEAIASIIIAVLLALVGLGFLREALVRLWSYRAVSFSGISIAVFLGSVLLKEGLARFAFWAGHRLDSRALVADGWHHRSDAAASGLIVLGALLGGRLWWVDGVMGVGVSLLILYVSYGIFKKTASSLLGEAADPELERKIVEIITRTEPSASNIHHLHVHNYGNHVEITLHLKLPPDMELKRAHDVISDIEAAIRRELGMEPTIHFEPTP